MQCFLWYRKCECLVDNVFHETASDWLNNDLSRKMPVRTAGAIAICLQPSRPDCSILFKGAVAQPIWKRHAVLDVVDEIMPFYSPKDTLRLEFWFGIYGRFLQLKGKWTGSCLKAAYFPFIYRENTPRKWNRPEMA